MVLKEKCIQLHIVTNDASSPVSTERNNVFVRFREKLCVFERERKTKRVRAVVKWKLYRCPIIPKREKHSQMMGITHPEERKTDKRREWEEIILHLMSQTTGGKSLMSYLLQSSALSYVGATFSIWQQITLVYVHTDKCGVYTHCNSLQYFWRRKLDRSWRIGWLCRATNCSRQIWAEKEQTQIRLLSVTLPWTLKAWQDCPGCWLANGWTEIRSWGTDWQSVCPLSRKLIPGPWSWSSSNSFFSNVMQM